MPRYKIYYTLERRQYVVVDAADDDQARDMFWSDEIDYEANPPKTISEELTDYIMIEETV